MVNRYHPAVVPLSTSVNASYFPLQRHVDCATKIQDALSDQFNKYLLEVLELVKKGQTPEGVEQFSISEEGCFSCFCKPKLVWLSPSVLQNTFIIKDLESDLKNLTHQQLNEYNGVLRELARLVEFNGNLKGLIMAVENQPKNIEEDSTNSLILQSSTYLALFPAKIRAENR